MRYSGYFLVAMLIAISACAKVGDYAETGNADDDEPAGDGKISFVLPQADNVVTYTAASPEEGGSTSDVVTIYSFSPSLRFEQSYTIPYSGGTNAAGGGRQYSITIQGRGKHNFVLLQAPAGYTLPQLSAGSTLGDLTSAWTQAVNGKLSPPFVMSNAQVDGKPYITVESIEDQSASVQVGMKSRVARIDLDDSECTILGVEISNAAPAGRMFDSDYAPAPPSSGGLTYSLAAGDLTNSGRSFYLYPTVLGAGATGTTVKIRAKLKTGGFDKTYTVMTGVDIVIEAGNLYSLSIDPVINPTIEENFVYTGDVQTFTAPYDDIYTLEAWGAQGADGRNNATRAGGTGGLGGYSLSRRTMMKGETLYIYVGQEGIRYGSDAWNGGKIVGNGGGGGGGGATDFRTAGGAWDNAGSLNSRILVAGGGGGGGSAGFDGAENGAIGGRGGQGGGGISPGGNGAVGNAGYNSAGGRGGDGGRNNGGSPTGGVGSNSAGDSWTEANGGVASGGRGFTDTTLKYYAGGGSGGGGYGGGGGGMRGNASTINTHGGSGGGGGGGGGSYGASDGTPGVNSGNGKARVTTYRAP